VSDRGFIGETEVRLQLVLGGRQPRESSEVPDEEESVGIRGCEESWGFVKKTAYKTVTVQLPCSYEL
jgi:hypothetical protein